MKEKRSKLTLWWLATCCCCAAVPSFCFSASSPNYNNDLSSAYSDLRRRANLLDSWPDSQSFCEQCLVFDPQTVTYSLPRFDDGYGPIGVFAFLGDDSSNVKARAMLQECDKAMDQFCNQVLEDIILPLFPGTGQQEQQRRDAEIQRWILRTRPQSYHITVAILQEHPNFVRDPNDYGKCRPLSDGFVASLVEAFQQEHTQFPYPPILELDSLLFTPDGALIAGFVEDGGSNRFERLRQSTREIAMLRMGDMMTSRPKNLIHATIGRVLGIPRPTGVGGPSLSIHYEQHQQRALTALCQEYNNLVFPQLVQDIRQNHAHCFELNELSLARNVVWMLEEYIIYGTWKTALSSRKNV